MNVAFARGGRGRRKERGHQVASRMEIGMKMAQGGSKGGTEAALKLKRMISNSLGKLVSYFLGMMYDT